MELNFKPERVESCPVCGSKHSKFWAEGFDRLHQTVTQRFEYSECQKCRTVFQSVRPPAESIGQFYPSTYSPYQSLTKAEVRSGPIERWLSKLDKGMRRRCMIDDLKRELKRIDENLKIAKTLVDFGCGAGNYLLKARKYGCEAIGVDFSPSALKEVSGKGFKALPVNDETWDALGEGKVGMFRLNHVVEHLYDPVDVLSRIHRALRSGGFLHIATPNPGGFSAVNFKTNWWGLECPRHIALMPPATLCALLEQVGFVDVQYFYDAHPKDIVRSFAYRLQEIFGSRIFDDVTTLAENRLLLAVASRWGKVSSLQQNGDRYHVTAYKPPVARAMAG